MNVPLPTMGRSPFREQGGKKTVEEPVLRSPAPPSEARAGASVAPQGGDAFRSSHESISATLPVASATVLSAAP